MLQFSYNDIALTIYG